MKRFPERAVISLEVLVIVQVVEISAKSEILGEDVLRVMFCVLVQEEESQLAMRRVGSAYGGQLSVSRSLSCLPAGKEATSQSARSEQFWVSSRLSISDSYRQVLSVSPLLVAFMLRT